ncbi:hypothetical protein FA15DRAFT_587271 [Coprinopsis marcescibilis]|uniref:Uncharacterized protein n=1 Tax=Coprinopsis marcescibilis TaxID=230819 RepID=A0A5C3L3A5_COPMA|nr:hypothetical protein FA15DRAFT_587271 [Coprinopsis marcescibilis]
MSVQNSNNRASLLAGLRTGGVRSSSHNVPHTAALTGSFNISRAPSYSNPAYFPEEEEEDQIAEMPQQHMHARGFPMTAAVDGPNNRFSHQQQGRMMNPNSVPFTPNFVPGMAQNAGSQNAMQMQMLQLEMLRIQQALQAQQAQQFQAEMMAQAQRQQQQQQMQMQAQARERRTSLGMNPPATAGPMTNSFDLRATAISAQMRRANVDQLRSQLGVSGGAEDQVPMTAALGGRFGSRSVSLNMPTEAYSQVPPPTPSTTVISGGTSLGAPPTPAPSKSDSASSWRRGGNNNSVLSGNRAVTNPSVKITPPPGETQRVSPPPGLTASASVGSVNATAGPKFRPQPLRFSPAVAQHVPAVTIDTTDEETDADTQSSGSSVKSSSPTTPRSSSSNDMPLSPREEASKKLYEGLGIGRPVSANQTDTQTQHYSGIPVVNHRMVSQPTRQPRGPPSGTEELGPKNFATRIRRKAIGGLGVLMDARERREIIVEAY